MFISHLSNLVSSPGVSSTGCVFFTSSEFSAAYLVLWKLERITEGEGNRERSREEKRRRRKKNT